MQHIIASINGLHVIIARNNSLTSSVQQAARSSSRRILAEVEVMCSIEKEGRAYLYKPQNMDIWNNDRCNCQPKTWIPLPLYLKLTDFFFPLFSQGGLGCEGVLSGVFANVFGNFHRAEMGATHGAEMCGLSTLLGKCLVVEGTGFFRV